MGVEAQAGQADLQTWLWWEADAMDRGGLRLGCCQPHQEPCREDRKVPAADLEKTVWFLACGRKWHLALHVCTLTNPSAITLTWELADNALCSNLLDQNLMVNNP